MSGKAHCQNWPHILQTEVGTAVGAGYLYFVGEGTVIII